MQKPQRSTSGTSSDSLRRQLKTLMDSDRPKCLSDTMNGSFFGGIRRGSRSGSTSGLFMTHFHCATRPWKIKTRRWQKGLNGTRIWSTNIPIITPSWWGTQTSSTIRVSSRRQSITTTGCSTLSPSGSGLFSAWLISMSISEFPRKCPVKRPTRSFPSIPPTEQLSSSSPETSRLLTRRSQSWKRWWTYTRSTRGVWTRSGLFMEGRRKNTGRRLPGIRKQARLHPSMLPATTTLGSISSCSKITMRL